MTDITNNENNYDLEEETEKNEGENEFKGNREEVIETVTINPNKQQNMIREGTGMSIHFF